MLGGGRVRLLGAFFDKNFAVGPIPGGNLVPPPNLARDAPRLNVAHPFEERVFPMLGHKSGLPLLDRGNRRAGQGLGIDEPLVGEPRLKRRTRPVAMGNRMNVILDAIDQAEVLHLGDDLFARREAVHAAPTVGHRVVEATLGIKDVDHLKVMALADLEIVEIMGRGDLDGARADLGIGIGVADYRYDASDDR